MAAFLGIDYGTTGFKVQLFDVRGRPLTAAGGELPVLHPAPGFVEQDSEQAWNAVRRAIQHALKSANIRADEIKAVGTTGTTNLTLYDHRGRILRPAIVYGDARLPPADELKIILNEFGPERIAAAFGLESADEATVQTILRTMCSAKLLWLRTQEPELFARIQHGIATSSDLVNYQLTGKVTHLAQAAAVDNELAVLFDLSLSWFGAPHQTGDVLGTVSPSAAAETGLAETTSVVMTAGDSSCAILGAGLVDPGSALNIAGTTDVVAVVTNDRPQSQVGYPVKHLLPNRWLLSLSPLRGPVLRWFRDVLLPSGATYNDIDRLASQAPPGAGGLLCLPYWTGEKGVVHDPGVRGMFVGLDVQHGLEHMARAILEGVAYGLREILEAYAANRVVASRICVSGGGARSHVWNQIKADVLGRPIQVLKVVETGCLGAAIIAAVATGAYANTREAVAKMVNVAQVVEPDPARAAIYEEGYMTYRQLYAANHQIFAALGHLRTHSYNKV